MSKKRLCYRYGKDSYHLSSFPWAYFSLIHLFSGIQDKGEMELAPSSHDARNKILISINNSQFIPHFLLDFRGEVFSLFLKLKYSQFTSLCSFL